MSKILFIAPHRLNRAPSQRFRFEQYLDFFNSKNFECDFSWLVESSDDKYLYKRGNHLQKFFFLLKSYKIRFNNLIHISTYDIIFVQREAMMFRSVFFEKWFSKKSKLIFDFDDAIWLMDVSDGNKNWKWLKNPSKTSKIIKLAAMVFAGNQYLANYASQFNKNIKIIPTTIDTEEYKPIYKNNNGTVCIGWSGSITTIKHFEYAIPFLIVIKKKYGDKVYFKVIGDDDYINDELGIKGVAWKKEDEIKELSSINIGIMPLPDDEWAKGKCGLKGLQYMSLEIPTIMSPVGVNTEIIQDGVNGFLANTEEEWITKISKLIESSSLRAQLGKNGRKTVIDRYSFQSQKQYYLQYFEELIKK
jgi:glycosyltransferase involved in cell wall biosynthesis